MVLPIKRTPSGDLSQVATGDTVELPGNVRSDATASGRVIGTPTQGFNEILLNKHAATGNLATARSLAATTAGSPGAVLVGVDIAPLVNSAPAQGDLQTVLEALDAASGGGGGGTLQTAYDSGNSITLDATGAVVIDDPLGSGNADGAALKVSGEQISAHVIDVTRAPASPVFAGNAINVTLSANVVGADGLNVDNAGNGFGIRSTVSAGAFGGPARFEGQGGNATPTSVAQTDVGNANAALAVDHAGTGVGLDVNMTGTGNAVRATTIGTGSALVVSKQTSAGATAARVETQASGGGTTLEVDQASPGDLALDAQVTNNGHAGTAVYLGHAGSGLVLDIDGNGGTNALLLARNNGTNVLDVQPTIVEVGTAVVPVLVRTHTVIRSGNATGTAIKSHEGYTTDIGSDPVDVNNLGRLFWREGTNTAPNTTADLAHRAGSEGETLLTKGGRLYATAVIREFTIEDTVTLAYGDVVAVGPTAGRCGLADPVTANGNDNAFGLCLVGGTGDAGGTVKALVAMGGYVDGLAGLTANTPVYLSDTTPGLLTSTVPSASGTTSIRIGFAISQSGVIIHVGEKVLIP